MWQISSWEASNEQAIQKVTVFMESQGSLSCWQNPASGPYPEPNESISNTSYTFKINFNNILPSAPICLKWSLPFRFTD
jgi:hypothetical protein